MILNNRKVILLLSMILALSVNEAVVAQANKGISPFFPTPENLKSNVEFWKNVYAKYSERDVIIHDSDDLSIIYTVVNLDSLFRGINISSRLEWKKIELIKKEYKSILLKLSRRRNLKLASLSGKEKVVAALFADDLSSKRLRSASRNIRGQTGLKERFKSGLERSGLYLSQMRGIFQAANLPLELLVLPHVESSFNYKAYSKLGAAGMWQFTRSTGRSYLKIDYTVDERLDPIRATEASAKLLKKNYDVLGTWPLAITAYNHGRTGMKRAKRKYGMDFGKIVKYYKSRTFGFASRNFYAEFLAALHVTNNYKFYFGDIKFHKPRAFIAFETPDYITVNSLLEKLNIDLEGFAEFNPALRPPVLQSKRRIPKYFMIRIPQKDGVDIEKLYAKISPEFKFDSQVRPEWHKVRSGENLSLIARKYRVSLSELMVVNNIRNAHRIYAGQNLQLPEGRKPRIISSGTKPKVKKPTQLAEVTDFSRKEKTIIDAPLPIGMDAAVADLKPTGYSSKENLTLVPAKPWATPDASFKNDKKLESVPVVQIQTQTESVDGLMAMALPGHYVQMTKNMGARIVKAPEVKFLHETFRDVEFPKNGQVVVEPEETLGHFADWLNVPTQKLRNINRISYSRPIQVRQHLLLTFEKITPEEFHARRVEYHQGIEEDFYKSFHVEGLTIYKVRSGDNIWDICNRRFEIPYWLAKKYNLTKDLFNLRIGDELVVPLVEARSIAALQD